MCSYFEKGLNNTIPSKIIGLPDYVRIVKDSSLIEKFNNIRNLRINGNDDYKILSEIYTVQIILLKIFFK